MTKDFIHQICRICLEAKDTSTMSILDEQNVSSIMECYCVQVDITEHLPEQVCDTCLKSLKSALKFKEKIFRSDQILKTFIQLNHDTDWLENQLFRVNTDTIKQENDFETVESDDRPSSVDDNVSEQTVNDETVSEEEVKREHVKKPRKEYKTRAPRRAPLNPRAKKRPPNLTCKKCGKIFNQEKRLIKHEIAHKYDLNGFRCPRNECGQTMARLKDLYAHMQNVHGGGRDFRCDLCNAGFFLVTQLDKHMISIHNVTSQTQSSDEEGDRIKREIDHTQIDGLIDDDDFKNLNLKIDENKLNDMLTLLHENGDLKKRDSPRERGNFQCPACPFVLSCHRSLQRHILQHLEPRFPCPADNCPRKFHESFRLNAHVRLKHKNISLNHTCEHCPEKFYSLELLQKHSKDRHSEIHEALCDTCGNYFKNIKEHLKTHKRESEVKQCKYCEKVFTNRQSLLKHIRSNHEKKICHICGKTYVFKTHLLKHEVSVMKPKKEDDRNGSYPCKVCNKVFKVKHNMQTHESVVHRSKTVQCKLCNLTMKRKSLQRHMVFKHTDKAAFSCDVCMQPCKTKESLQNHMRTHTDERPYACTYCEKRFRQSKTCLYHMRLHTGERPHVCKICDKRFAQPYALTVHIKTHAKYGKNNVGSAVALNKFL